MHVSAPVPIGEGGFGRNSPTRLLLTRQRQHPCGASGLAAAPTPDDTRSYSITFTTHPLNQEIRASVGAAARTGGRARGACGEGGTTGAPDLLSAGHSPHPFGLLTGLFLPIMRGHRPAPVCGSSPSVWSTGLKRYTYRRRGDDQQQ